MLLLPLPISPQAPQTGPSSMEKDRNAESPWAPHPKTQHAAGIVSFSMSSPSPHFPLKLHRCCWSQRGTGGSNRDVFLSLVCNKAAAAGSGHCPETAGTKTPAGGGRCTAGLSSQICTEWVFWVRTRFCSVPWTALGAAHSAGASGSSRRWELPAVPRSCCSRQIDANTLVCAAEPDPPRGSEG